MATLFLADAAKAERRLALVIGVDKYPNLPANKQLLKAVNDARAVGAALSNIGFTVSKVENASRDDMSEAFGKLEQNIAQGDTVFIFFSGHGIDIKGTNYLLPGDIPSPIDAQGLPRPPRTMSDKSFNAADLLSSFQNRGAGTVIAVFDACREPFDDDGKKNIGVTGVSVGMAEMRPAKQVYILFSAGAKQLALDRLGRDDTNPNSVFTRNLVPLLSVRGQSLVDMAKALQPKVRTLAATVGHEQTPAYYDEIIGNFYLVPGDATPTGPVASATPTGPVVVDPCVGVYEHWQSTEKIASRAAYEAHVKAFPTCAYAGLARARLVGLEQPSQTQPQIQIQQGPVDTSVCDGPGSLWDVDGSTVVLRGTPNNPNRQFYYCKPGGSARAEGAKPGNLLFSGQRSGSRYLGTAYINTGKCGSFSYSVNGSVTNSDQSIYLSGRSPVVDQSSCRVGSYRDAQFSLNYRQRLN